MMQLIPRSFPPHLELVNEAFHGGDEDVRRLKQIVRADPHAGGCGQPIGQCLRFGQRMVRHDDGVHGRVDVELQTVEAVGGRLAHPGDLLLGR
jgi:hypothetical protein